MAKSDRCGRNKRLYRNNETGEMSCIGYYGIFGDPCVDCARCDMFISHQYVDTHDGYTEVYDEDPVIDELKRNFTEAQLRLNAAMVRSSQRLNCGEKID